LVLVTSIAKQSRANGNVSFGHLPTTNVDNPNALSAITFIMKYFLIIFFLIINSCNIPTREKPIVGYFSVTAYSGLILRRGPGIEYDKLTNLRKGTIGPIYEYIGSPIEIKGYKGRWILTQIENQTGYIFSGHVFISDNKESFEEVKGKNPFISQFKVAEKGKTQFTKDIIKKNPQYFGNNNQTRTKDLFETSDYKLSVLEYNEQFLAKMLFKESKLSGIIEYPDSANFHPVKYYENNRIIQGEMFICYECCAWPLPIFGLLGKNKSFLVYASILDSEAKCFPESFSSDYNRLRYSDIKNEIYIHIKSGKCTHDLVENCMKLNKDDNCRPKEFSYERFLVIKNPYDEPIFQNFHNEGIPDIYIEEYNKARKLKESK
jgi:hypothetical protein